MSRAKKIYITFGLVIATCLLSSQYRDTLQSQYTMNEIRTDHITDVPTSNPPKNTKTILYWTPMFGVLDFNFGVGTKIFQNCTYKNCYATYNKEELPVEKFDAILFHGVEYTYHRFGKPEKRSPHQVYTFSIQESPIYTPRFISDYNNFYNWTMTYRLDSDILRAYGVLEKTQTQYVPPTAEEIQQRSKKIAWFVSNCDTSSERERLYNEIRKYVQVDVYGYCGDLKCPRNNANQCYSQMEKDYKFYLSFENSICEDYVTEKLYNVLKRNIVPIVYGGADYSTIAPPHSVINVMDYKSVKELAEYIRFLDTHPEDYLKYFEWKKDYTINTNTVVTVCSLCQKLNEPIKAKTYSDLTQWWCGDNLDKCSTSFIKRYL